MSIIKAFQVLYGCFRTWMWWLAEFPFDRPPYCPHVKCRMHCKFCPHYVIEVIPNATVEYCRLAQNLSKEELERIRKVPIA